MVPMERFQRDLFALLSKVIDIQLFSFDTWVSKYSYNMFIMELSENKLQIGKMEIYFGNMFPFNIVMLLWH